MKQAYKFLWDGTSVFVDTKWSLPTEDRPGEWMPAVEGPLVHKQCGYHLAAADYLVDWLYPELYEAQYRSDTLQTDRALVVREVRLLRRIPTWNERSARHFAADCADWMIHWFWHDQPGDERVSQAISLARRYAEGRASRDERGAAQRRAREARAGCLQKLWYLDSFEVPDPEDRCLLPYNAASAAVASCEEDPFEAARLASQFVVDRIWKTGCLMKHLQIRWKAPKKPARINRSRLPVGKELANVLRRWHERVPRSGFTRIPNPEAFFLQSAIGGRAREVLRYLWGTKRSENLELAHRLVEHGAHFRPSATFPAACCRHLYGWLGEELGNPDWVPQDRR